MNQNSINIKILEASSTAELVEADAALLAQAVKATQTAYAPYSKFRVGAAVRLSNGTVVTGSNQENAAYPSGLCAERTALFYAHAQYPHLSVEAIAITAESHGALLKTPTYPCGACRQVMLESEQRGKQPVRVIMGGTEKIQITESAAALLPLAFDSL